MVKYVSGIGSLESVFLAIIRCVNFDSDTPYDL